MNIKLADKIVGENYMPYFIADVAANHDGDINRAYKLIELAKESGADAAKFQNFKANKIVSKSGFENQTNKLSHQTNWEKSVYEVYEDASIPDNWTSKLYKKCQEVGIEYMTSPYDLLSVDLANAYVNCFKIGSGDITWLEIIEHMASKGKPIILATGASSQEDVDRAMNILKNNPVILMQCNTNYTASEENYSYINLNVLKYYKEKYNNVVLGLSDHTKGSTTVIAAIALGARVIEKHFTDDDTRSGPDHAFSTMPKEWASMVKQARECFFSLGDGIKRVEENEKQTTLVQRRCIYINKNINAGEKILEEDLDYLRPVIDGAYLPFEKNDLIGKIAFQDIKCGECIKKAEINGGK